MVEKKEPKMIKIPPSKDQLRISMTKKNSESDSKHNEIATFVKRAINILAEKQISRTVVLSSHKINSAIRTYIGEKIKINKVGRTLAKIAKKMNLERLETKVPKYVLRLDNFSGFKA